MEDKYVSPRIRKKGDSFIRFVYRGKLEEVKPAMYMIEKTPLTICGMIAYGYNFNLNIEV